MHTRALASHGIPLNAKLVQHPYTRVHAWQAWGTRGHEFESRRSDHKNPRSGGVFVCSDGDGAEGRGYKMAFRGYTLRA